MLTENLTVLSPHKLTEIAMPYPPQTETKSGWCVQFDINLRHEWLLVLVS